MEPVHDHSHDAPGSPVAILDSLFPGFGLFTNTLRQQWGIDISLYLHVALVLGILVYGWMLISDYVLEWAKAALLCTAEIRPDDEVYNVVMAWIASQPVASNSRRFFVNMNLSSRIWSAWSMDDDPDESGAGNLDSRHSANKKTLSYTPSYGSHLLWFDGRPILFRRRKADEPSNSPLGATKREEISLSSLGYSPGTLKRLLAAAYDDYLRKDQEKTIIYRAIMHGQGHAYWSRCTARDSRPFSTIHTRPGLKEAVIDDVADYLAPETRAWYANCGIPWRRGYLFAGPPGTGKSSLSFALAGHFRLKIYTLSLSSSGATEENLATLFSELPQSCVVLFEDVDAAGMTHARTGGGKSRRSSSGRGKGRVSLSGLLNLLDGVASQEGRILIMTTNHAEHLDKALIRPGRVDMTLQFELADAHMAGSIFRGVYAHLHAGLSEKGAAEADNGRAVRAKIEELAGRFEARIPPGEFSPAEVQGYLIRHRREPGLAVDGAEEWVQAVRRDREEAGRTEEGVVEASEDSESGDETGEEESEEE